MNDTPPSRDLNEANKDLVAKLWVDLTIANEAEAGDVFGAAMAANVAWHGHAPLGSLEGLEAVVSDFWLPLMRSFTNLRRETHLFFGGQSNGRTDGDIARDGRWWVTGTGLFHGTFEHDYLGIPATGKPVSIRWGDFSCVEGGVITEVYFLIDMVDLMQQAGFDVLPPARGVDGIYPPPAAGDGRVVSPADAAITTYSLDHIRRFIFDGLNGFDKDALDSMGMADWFHPAAQWYGPGGIGACLSFQEFEDLHQAPCLGAFPERQVQDLDALFAEGLYTGAPGCAGVRATHTGSYLDQPATGRPIEFNGLDWWKREGEHYIENWVFVDMVHLFEQFGVDLIARVTR